MKCSIFYKYFLQLDLPFSITFYRWLLGQEHSLSLVDLHHVSPDIHKTLRKLEEIVRKRDRIQNDNELSIVEKNEMVSNLEFCVSHCD